MPTCSLHLLLFSLFLCSAVQADPVPFECNGQAYVARFSPAQLFAVNTNTDPFAFDPVGNAAEVVLPGDSAPTPIELNNLGYRSTNNLIYALALKKWDEGAPYGNYGLVKVDSAGNVFPTTAMLSNSPIPGLGSTNYRFPAGDISSDGTTMYISAQVTQVGSTAPAARKKLYKMDLETLQVTTVDKTAPVASINVADWAYNPINGMLYGAQAEPGPARIWQLNPNDGSMIIVPGSGALGLPSGNLPIHAYGGAWFNSVGDLYLHRNNGEIFVIDLTGEPGQVGGCNSNCPSVTLHELSGDSSNYNDATACATHTNQGCTPGYWKQSQHFNDWTSYSPDPADDFDTVFGLSNTNNSGLTLLEALDLMGGGFNALIRHAVAALLNAASADVSYVYSVSQIIELVQVAYTDNDPEPTKNKFEFQNERGCPL